MTQTMAPGALPRLLELPLRGTERVSLRTHLETYGPLPAQRYTSPTGPNDLADALHASGLTGRGGGAFPAGAKVRAVAANPRRPAVVVANGCESEPDSGKDTLLLSCVPHLVLDGLVACAGAVGAERGYIVVGDEALAASLRPVVAERRDPLHLEVMVSGGGYVASQDTALVNWINGGRPIPTFTPPRPDQRGVKGRPTLVNNVETLAHIALIARYGPRWFREAGVPSAPGSALVTVGGAVARPGVLEIGLGTTIRGVLEAAGGPTEPLQAVLTGGYFGAWLPLPAALNVPMTPGDLRAAGGAMGAGVLIGLPVTACPLAETAGALRYLANARAGQCGPCEFGMPALAEAFTTLAHAPKSGVSARIAQLCRLIEGRGACRHPDGAARLAATSITAFTNHVTDHERRGACLASRSVGVLAVNRQGVR